MRRVLGSLPSFARSLRRAVLLRRRLLAVLLTGAAVATGLASTQPAAPRLVPVVVAAADLPAGTVLTADDVVIAGFTPATAPSDRVASTVGSTLAAPLLSGDPVTRSDLVGPERGRGYPGLVTMPVRLTDAVSADLLTVGDRVDLIATDPAAGGAEIVAREVVVLALPSSPHSPGSALDGRLVLMGVPVSGVVKVSDAAARKFLTFSFSV